MTIHVISSGVTTGGITVSGGDDLEVLSGGSVQSDTVLSGGTELLSSGATDFGGSVVLAGGTLDGTGDLTGELSIFGLAADITIGSDELNAGSAFVESSGVASALLVADGYLEIESSGITYSTIISGTYDYSTGAYTAQMQIDRGAIATGSIDFAGDIAVYGSASDTNINGGEQDVESGGIATDTTIANYGYQEIVSGGVASGSLVGTYSTEEVLSGGETFGAVILSAGLEIINFGATANGVTVSSGGTVDFSYSVSSGEKLIISSPVSEEQTATSLTAISGVTILSGGIIENANYVILSGGQLDLNSGIEFSEAISVQGGGILSGPGVENNYADVFGAEDGLTLSGQYYYADLYVESGGVASGTTLIDGLDYIDSGGEDLGTIVSGPSEESVLFGGFASGDVILDSGTEYLEGGALASSIVLDGGIVQVYGAADSTIVESGIQYVNSGGRASGTVVGANGEEIIQSGGTVNDTIVELGGNEYVLSGGEAFGLSVSGGTEFVELGGVDDGGQVLSGEMAVIGVASKTTVSTGAEIIYSGGLGDDATVASGGLETVLSGGAVSGTIVESGGTIVLSSGASATGVTVSSGATADLELIVSSGVTIDLASVGAISSGTTIDGVTLLSGANLEFDGPVNVLSGGALALPASVEVGVGATISAGGSLAGPGVLGGRVDDYGLVSGVSVGASDIGYAYMVVEAGGLASAVEDAFGEVIVAAGGHANSVIVGSIGGYIYDALEVGSGGVASSTVIESGEEYTLSGGETVGVLVSSGGEEIVSSGGLVNGGLILSGAILTGAATVTGVLSAVSGAVVSGATIASGGVDQMYIGSLENDVTVSSGGVLALSGAMVSNGVTLSAGVVTETETFSGVTLLSGAILSSFINTLIISSGVTALSSGVTSNRLTVLSGAEVDVLAGGTAINTIDEGLVQVESGGLASGTTVLSGGDERVSSGGTASGAVVLSGGREDVTGFDVGLTVQSGGSANIGGGGSVRGGLVAYGGVDQVLVGGEVTGTVIEGETFDYGTVSGGSVGAVNAYYEGELIVESGALASGVMDYAYMVVASGGTALATTAIYDELYVASGGAVSGTTLSFATEENYGVASNTVIGSGGYDYDDGLGVGTVVAPGGVETVDAGGVTVNGTVLAGGLEIIDSGAVASGLTVSSGGVFGIWAIVSSGQTESATLTTVTGTTTGSGATQLSGAQILVEGATVQSGGQFDLSSGDVLSAGANIEAGGVLSGLGILFGGEDFGIIDGVTIENGYEYIYSGGSIGAVTDLSYIGIQSGGSAIDTLVEDQLYIGYGGYAYSTTIIGSQYIASAIADGSAADTVVDSAADLYIYGIATNTIVNSGGAEFVGPLGSALAATVYSGGSALVSAGGSAISTTVTGGSQTLLNGGVSIETTTIAGGVEIVDLGATAISAVIGSSGQEFVALGGTLDGGAVLSGGLLSDSGTETGLLVVSSGGAVSGAIIVSGGVDRLYSGGSETDVTIQSGASLALSGAIVSNGLTLSAGVVSHAETVSGVTLMSGAILTNFTSGVVISLTSDSVNFGIVHVGDSVSAPLMIENTTSGDLTDLLSGGFSSVSHGFEGIGALDGVAVGSSGQLTLTLDTVSAGVYNGSAGLALVAQYPDGSDVEVSAGPVSLQGTVDNYANPEFEEVSGGGVLSQIGDAFFLNLGTLAAGETPDIELAVANAVAGPADELSGSFSIAGDGDISNSGFGAFSGIGAGQTDSGLNVTLETGAGGAFSETIILSPTGSNPSGYSGALNEETLTIYGKSAVSPANSDVYRWIGSTGGVWGSASNWEDVTTGTDPATSVPGSNNVVTIAAAASTIYEVIGGGGSAASLGITGNVDLNGVYSTGVLSVGSAQRPSSGSVSYATGGLALGAGSVVTAASVSLIDGTITIAGAGAGLDTSGVVTVGSPQIDTYSSQHGYLYDYGALGTLSLSVGASLAAAGLVVADGRLSASGAGTSITIDGALTLGTPYKYTSSTSGNSTASSESGVVDISGGASVSVTGAITANGEEYYEDGDDSILVTGTGTTLTAGGTLTLGVDEEYLYDAPSLAVTSGASVTLAGLAFEVVGTSSSSSQPTAYISVDSASSIEVGSAGSAAVGALTIDTGQVVTAAVGVNIIGQFVDNGTISETGGELTLDGGLSGSGYVQLGAGSTFQLEGDAAAGATIDFAGASATLEIGAAASYDYSTETYTYTPYAVASTLSGFAVGDGIIVDDATLTSAVYTYDGGNSGVLDLYAGTSLIESLTLAGNYTGQTFFISPTTNGSSAIGLLASNGVGNSPVSTNSDVYRWIGSTGGVWGSASNWEDVTTGTDPATSVPGSNNVVTIAAAASTIYEVIGGGGSAASLGITGNVDLNGVYSTGVLSVGSAQRPSSGSVSYATGGLALGAGSVVTAASVSLIDGTITIAGAGAGLDTSGVVTVGSPQIDTYSSQHGYLYDYGALGTLSLSVGASLAAAGLVVADGRLSASGAGTSITIDGALTLGTPYKYTSSTSGNSTASSESGVVDISGGASVSVTGAITANGEEYYEDGDDSILVTGTGTTLTAGGTLTLGVDEEYLYDAPSLAVTSGASVTLAGLAFEVVGTSSSSSQPTAYISVDSASSIEVGSAGSAAVGALTIDTGQVVTAAVGVNIIGQFVDNGTISETGGELTLDGGLSGSGYVQLGAGSTFQLEGDAAAGATIDFAGASATLEIGAAASYDYSTETYTYTPYAVASTLSGFAVGDGIIVDDATLTSAVYTYDGGNSGVLDLYAGTSLIESLTLAGNYTGQTFFISPTTNGSSAIGLLASNGVGNSPVSTNSDVYRWIGSTGGVWGSASNWEDVTTGTDPATSVPGSNNVVTIAAAASTIYEVIGGGGSAASLGITGNVDLNGVYSTGVLSVGSAQRPSSGSVSYATGGLALGAGSVVTAASVSLIDGTITIAGAGAGLDTSGVVTVGSPQIDTYSSQHGYLYDYGALGTLSLSVGASLAAAGLVVADGRLSASGAGTSITIDGALTLGTPYKYTSSTSGNSTASSESGVVDISGGASVSVTGAITANGEEYYEDGDDSILVTGTGTTLTAGGTLTLGVDEEYLYDAPSLAVTSGASVTLAGLAFEVVGTSSSSSQPTAYISVDSASSIEVGSAGSAAVGALTIDTGQVVTAAVGVNIIGQFVDNGTISETGGELTLDGGLSGSGYVQLGAGSTFQLEGDAAAGATIDFAGASATLEIGAAASYDYSTETYTYTPYAVASTLSGFAVGDGIIVDDATLTSAVYTYDGGNSGVLDLYAGTSLIESLTLAGNYTGQTFFISPTTNGSSAVSVLARPVGTAPASETLLQGVSAALSGFSVADPDALATSLTVTLSDTKGLLSASNSGGARVDGAGTTSLTLSGTLTQVNAALTTLSDLEGTTGTDTITVDAVDSEGSEGLQAGVPVTVLAIAPPTITVPTNNVVTQFGAAPENISVSLAYPDGAVEGEQVIATLSDTSGLLSVNASTVGGGGVVVGSGTNELSISGTLSQVDADLATLSYSAELPGLDSIEVTAAGTHGGDAAPASFTVQTLLTVSSGAILDVMASSTVETLYGSLTVFSGGVLDLAGIVVLSGGTIDLNAGAVLSGPMTVSSGGTISGPGALAGTIDDYGTIDAASVGSGYPNGLGGKLYVEAGGLVSGVLEEGLSIEVMSGGQADGLTASDSYSYDDAELLVDSGGVVSGTILSNGYAEIYGTASGTIIERGYDTVQSGGEAVATTVDGGATEYVKSAGTASGASIGSGGQEVVSSGGSLFGATIQSGGLLILSSGATATDVTVSRGATVDITVTVSSGTTLEVTASSTSGATFDGVTLQSGATLNPEGVVVDSGGTLRLDAGAVLSGPTTVSSGGTVSGPGALVGTIDDYGTIDAASVGSDYPYGLAGALYVEAGGLISGVIEDGPLIEVKSGALAGGVTVSDAYSYDDAELLVDSGGVASGTVLSNGHAEIYGTAIGTVIDGGYADVWSGGETVDTTLDSGGAAYVEAGGFDTGTVVSSGGAEAVSSGGSLAGATIDAGGVLILYAGAETADVTVSSGATLDEIATVVSGATLEVTASTTIGAIPKGVTLESGAILNLGGVTVGSGGIIELDSGAVLDGPATVSAGGTISGLGALTGDIYDYGVIDVASIGDTGPTASPGYVYVNSGGLISGLLEEGAFVEVMSGGQADGLTVSNSSSPQYAELVVESGGAASGTVLSDGIGAIGGVASGTVVEGGYDDVLSGGEAVGTTVDSGGIEYVASGGTASGSVVSSGGVEVVSSGGALIGATIEAGGELILSAGAATSDLTVSSGGEIVFEGASSTTPQLALQGISLAVSGAELNYLGAAAADYSVTITDTAGALSASAVSGGTITNLVANDLEITGTLSEVDAALATLSYDSNNAGADTIIVRSTDSNGVYTVQPDINMDVLSIEPPTVSVSEAALATGVGQALSDIPVSITYPDGGVPGEQVEIELADTAGELSVSSSAAGGGGTITGSGTNDLIIGGSLSQVNADLATLSYVSDAVGSDTVTATAVGTHGGTSTPTSFTIETAGLPEITAPPTVDLIQGAESAIGISLTEASYAIGETFTVNVSDTDGLLSASGTNVTGSGSNSLTITGTLSSVNASLATITDTDPSTDRENITVTSTDSFGNTTSGTVAATVTPVVPEFSSPTNLTIAVGVSTPLGINLSEPSYFAGETVTATVTDTIGILTATGADVSGSGTQDLTITGTEQQVNATLEGVAVEFSADPTDTINTTISDAKGNVVSSSILVTATSGLQLSAANYNELFASILAMDTYNRGYGATVNGLSDRAGDSSAAIGEATVTDRMEDPGHGFYALSYDMNGKTVISYRGTSWFTTLNGILDVLYGWTAGAGDVNAPQLIDATNFYMKVTGELLTSGPQSDVLLVGHSLGGGLAGYIAALTGDSAYTFDTMPYGAAALNGYNAEEKQLATVNLPPPSPINGKNITNIYTKGEILESIRDPNSAVSTILTFFSSTANTIANQNIEIQDQGSNVAPLNPVAGSFVLPTELHSPALLVLLEYAKYQPSNIWQNIGPSLFNAYFNDSLGKALGLSNSTGAGGPADQMLTMIAYSAIQSGYAPFGNTAIQSLFAGANTAGFLFGEKGISNLLSANNIENDVADIDVEYSGLLAEHSDTDSVHIKNVFSTDSRNDYLDIDLSLTTWSIDNSSSSPILQINNSPPSQIVGEADLIQNLFGVSIDNSAEIDNVVLCSNNLVSYNIDLSSDTDSDFVFSGRGAVNITLGSGSTYIFTDPGNDDVTMNTDGTLVLCNPDAFSGEIEDFGLDNLIDLKGVAPTSAALSSSDLLNVGNVDLQLTGSYTGDFFETYSDGRGGTDVQITTLSIAPVGPAYKDSPGTATFTITRTDNLSAAETVYVSTTDGTEVAGESVNEGDFGGLSNDPVTFAAGSSTATFSVQIFGGDGQSGPAKTFGLVATDSPDFNPSSSDLANEGVLATDEFTLTPPATAGALGCPHFTTFSGGEFDFQGAGEFVAVKSTTPGNNFQVQMRIEPEFSSDSSVSIITQIAVQVGSDRVTFDADRSQTSGISANPVGDGDSNVVWVDGVAAAIDASNPILTLNGGTVTEVSSQEYIVTLNTGERVTIDPFGDGMGLSVALSASDDPGSVEGFFGPDEGQSKDFMLPDGTVLQQPLTQAQLYQTFANAWRVTDATSLLDYGPGQDTETFTNAMYPREILTLSDFSPAMISAAAALVASFGITDPTLAADAEFDYLSMGDPELIAHDAAIAGPDVAPSTPAVITAEVTPPPSIGVLATSPSIVESSSGFTAVSFEVNLTSAATADTVVDYAVSSDGMAGFSDGRTYFSAADFGGTLPSGSVTIAAGETEATVTIDVPVTALSTTPDKWLELLVSSPGDTNPVYGPNAQTDVINDTPVPGPAAEPVFRFLTNAKEFTSENGATLTQAGSTFTVDLGDVLENASLPALQFAVANMASEGSDSLSATIASSTGSGFDVTGTDLPETITAGNGYQGLFVQAKTTSLGAQSETITLTSSDVNETGYSGSLPEITLIVEDTIIAPASPSVSTNSITIPNERVGGSESEAVTVNNTAPSSAANLDATLSATAGATVAGSVTLLAPGDSDSTDLSVGLDTSTPGDKNSVVTVNTSSDLGNGVEVPALPSPTITVSGSVYREASGQITSSQTIVHVDDPGAETLVVANTDPADGYSEGLLATVRGSSGAISVNDGATGLIAAGASDSTTLTATFSTATAGVVSGSVAADFQTDGDGTSGLGTLDLGVSNIPLSITVDNYAQAALEETAGGGTWSGSAATGYTLDLGALHLGQSPVTVDLSALNSATGPADLLSGAFTLSGSSAFTNAGFDDFSGLGAGQADTDPTVTLSTSAQGTFTETITLQSTGSNASGYSGALADETLTITGTVSGALAQAQLNTASPIVLGDVRVGGVDSEALSITNSAATGSEGLDVSVGSTTGSATASGTISQLAAGATDSTSVTVGLDTSTAGAQSGTVTLGLASDGASTDGQGVTPLSSQTVEVAGAVYREASATFAALPATIVVHVGDTVALPLSVSNTDPADGYSENLQVTVDGTTGEITASPPTGEIAAGQSSSLSLGFSTATSGMVSGSATLGLASDGTGIDGFGPSSIGSQTVQVNATVDNYAQAALDETAGGGTWSGGASTGYTLDLGTVQLGSGALTIDLAALNDATGLADLLSGSFSVSGSSAFSNSGFSAFSGLGAGQSDNGPSITLNTDAAGTFTETITLQSTGSNASGYSGALANETLTITGTVSAGLARAQLNTASPIDLGDVRVGGADSQALSITNSAATGSDGLDVSVGSTTGAATASGAISQLAAGMTDTSSVTVGLDTSTAGAQSGSVTLDFASDGASTDGQGVTPLVDQTVQVEGAVYREASTSVPALPTAIVVHVGDTVAQPLSVSNTDPADGYSENLQVTVDGTTGGVTASPPTGEIAAGQSSSLSLGFSTATSGMVSGSVTLGLASDGTGIDGFGPSSIGSQTVLVNAAVDNYAQVALEETSGGGTWSGSAVTGYTLDLGTVQMGSGPLTIDLAALNSATGLADLLSGSFSISGSSAFANSGFAGFSGLGAGQSDNDPTVTLNTNAAGTFTETITLQSAGSNASGYSGALANETLTITGTIANNNLFAGLAPPVAGAAPTLTAVDGAPATMSFSELTGLVTDVSHTPLSVTAATLAAGSAGAGTVTLDTAAQSLVFTPAAGFAGSAVADVTVVDGDGLSVVQPVDLSALVEASSATISLPNTTQTTVQGDKTTTNTFSASGVLLGYTVTTVSTNKTVTETYDADNTLTGASIEQDFGNGMTQLQVFGANYSLLKTIYMQVNGANSSVRTYDAGGTQQSATYTTVNGSQTVIRQYGLNGINTGTTIITVSGDQTTTQNFDGTGAQTSAVIVTVNGGQTETQNFDGHWRQTSATIVTMNGGQAETQNFDGHWNQTSATIVTVNGGLTETQHFDGHWNQTSATIVTVNGGQTETQNFDGHWNQTSATIVTVNGNQTVDQSFTGNWTMTGATVNTVFSGGPLYSQLNSYDANWKRVSQLDAGSNGQETYFVYGQAGGGQTITAPSGHSDTFIFTPGTLTGDTLLGLHTLNLGGSLHDVIDFVGYGTGAALIQLNATQWEVTSPDHATETFTLTGGATLAAGDYSFTAAPPPATSVPTVSLAVNAVDGDGFINGAQSAAGIVLTGSAFDAGTADVVGQSVTVTLNGQTYVATVGADGVWSASVSAANLEALADGVTYQVDANITDTLGDSKTATQSVTVDRTASLAINAIDGDGVIGSTELSNGLTISGTSVGSVGSGDFAGQLVTVTLDANSYHAAVDANGEWSVALSPSQLAGLNDGQAYKVTVTATDNAANVATTSSTVIVDDSALPLGSRVLQATGVGQTITADGSVDTIYGSAVGGDTFNGTAASLNGDNLVNFGLSGDKIDETNVAYTGAAPQFAEDPSQTFGILIVGSGAMASKIILFGQFMASNFQAASDGGAGTLIAYAPPLTHPTLTAPLG